MTRYLLTILCSNNLEQLKTSYQSAINQINYNDYHIYIVVNSLDDNLYYEIINYFKQNSNSKLKKIVRCEANEKSGKAYNLLLNIFISNPHYEYLLILDSNDFYYPSALERINYINNKYDLDMLFLVANSKISKKTEITTCIKDIKDVQQDIDYNVIVKYTINKFKSITNIDKIYNDIIATPFRLISTNRKIFLKYIKLFDDNINYYYNYNLFLIIYKIFNESNFNPIDIKINFLNDSYIYLSNCLNKNNIIDSLNLQNELNLIENIKKELNIDKLYIEKFKIISIEIKDEEKLKKIEDDFLRLIIQRLKY